MTKYIAYSLGVRADNGDPEVFGYQPRTGQTVPLAPHRLHYREDGFTPAGNGFVYVTDADGDGVGLVFVGNDGARIIHAPTTVPNTLSEFNGETVFQDLDVRITNGSSNPINLTPNITPYFYGVTSSNILIFSIEGRNSGLLSVYDAHLRLFQYRFQSKNWEVPDEFFIFRDEVWVIAGGGPERSQEFLFSTKPD